jgi:protein-tyrosine kinase
MERIQLAIERARAERAAAGHKAASKPDAAVVDAAPTQSDETKIAAAWGKLSRLVVRPADLAKNRIVAYEAGQDSVIFDVVRTRMVQQMRANGWRRIALTSPTPGCGKSTVALNLAFSFARQRSLRTILADVDLRRPSLAKMLGHVGQQSFADVLAGRMSLAETALCHDGCLAVLPNAGPTRNSAELLQAPQVPGILSELETDYAPDILLFDTPPLMVSDDTMAFMGQVDAVLIIAAADQTTTREVDTCERELASLTNVMGVVLNKCRFVGPEYGYDYYYG